MHNLNRGESRPTMWDTFATLKTFPEKFGEFGHSAKKLSL
jgi:hypothetical protein